MCKRFLSALLSLCMVLTILPINALAMRDDTAPVWGAGGSNKFQNFVNGLEDQNLENDEVDEEGELDASEFTISSLDGATQAPERNASEVRADGVTLGKCGDNVYYELSSDGILHIRGTGDMDNYVERFITSESSAPSTSPFSANNRIKSIIIEEGVTSIGNYAFSGIDSLTAIQIPDSVTSVLSD